MNALIDPIFMQARSDHLSPDHRVVLERNAGASSFLPVTSASVTEGVHTQVVTPQMKHPTLSKVFNCFGLKLACSMGNELFVKSGYKSV